MALMIGLIGVFTGGYEAIADKFGHHHHKEEVTHHENHEDHHLQQEDRTDRTPP